MDPPQDDDADIENNPLVSYFRKPKYLWNRDLLGSNLPIQDQGDTLNCTAYAMAAVLYSHYFIKYNWRRKLSIQQMIDHFSWQDGAGPVEGVAVKLKDAVSYVHDCGLILDSEYPLRGHPEEFVMPQHPVDVYSAAFKEIPVTSFLPELKKYPILASISFGEHFKSWSRSLSPDLPEIYVPPKREPPDLPEPKVYTHAFAIVGYGDEDLNIGPYYVIQDSYGDDKHSGYKKISVSMFEEVGYGVAQAYYAPNVSV